MTQLKEGFTMNVNKTIVMELNHFCNLRCVHCYVPRDEKVNHTYMTFEDANLLFDKIQESGLNRVLFTGGEPLANPDFLKIYEEAWDRGFIISVFTNATLIDDECKQLFVTKKPALIRISLFGGSEETYEKVTGVNLFRRVYENILFLKQQDMEVRVKIPLLRQNIADIRAVHDELRDMAISSKLEVRILPRYDGDTETLQYRFTPEEILALQIDNENASLQQYESLKGRPMKTVRDLHYCLHECQPFLIAPDSHLNLCFFIRDEQIDLRDHRFEDAIQLLVEKTETSITNTNKECHDCQNQSMCPYCPGWAKMEEGNYHESIHFLCDLVQLYDEKYKSLLSVYM